MNDLPSPLVPPEVDLTDFKFMPLEVARLLDSEWWTVACLNDPRMAMAAVNLWAKAWHQKPAASLPNNPKVLAAWARVPLSVWDEIGAEVMEPWRLCSDGRWYHPVVAEKALEAWKTKKSYAKRDGDFSYHQSRRAKAGWAKRRAGNAGAMPDGCRMDAEVMPGHAEAMPGQCPGNANESNRNRNSKKERDFVPNESANALFTDPDGSVVRLQPKGEGYTADFDHWWAIYPRKEGKGAAFKAFRAAKKLWSRWTGSPKPPAPMPSGSGMATRATSSSPRRGSTSIAGMTRPKSRSASTRRGMCRWDRAGSDRWTFTGSCPNGASAANLAEGQMTEQIAIRQISMDHAVALDKRGLDPTVAVGLGLWTLPAKNGVGEAALAIPFFREGVEVNSKFRTRIVPGGDKGKVWQSKGGVQCF